MAGQVSAVLLGPSSLAASCSPSCGSSGVPLTASCLGWAPKHHFLAQLLGLAPQAPPIPASPAPPRPARGVRRGQLRPSLCSGPSRGNPLASFPSLLCAGAVGGGHAAAPGDRGSWGPAAQAGHAPVGPAREAGAGRAHVLQVGELHEGLVEVVQLQDAREQEEAGDEDAGEELRHAELLQAQVPQPGRGRPSDPPRAPARPPRPARPARPPLTARP